MTLSDLKEKSKIQSLTPEETLFQMTMSFGIAHCLIAAAHLRIADWLEDGSKHCNELAELTGTHAPTLYRMLRALASVEVFAEIQPETFALTELARCLQEKEQHSIRHFLFFLEPTIQCFAGLQDTLRTGKGQCERKYGMHYFDYLAQHPDVAENYDRAMIEVTLMQDPAIIAAYDFANARQVVDVGGGKGYLLAALLREYPHLQGILFDVPRMAEPANALFAQCGLAARCVARGGDFFSGDLPAGADIYMMKYVVHTWPDDQVIALLRACRAVMGQHSRLLVIERVITEDTSWMPKFADLNMLMLFSSAVRTPAQFSDLFERAGFCLERIIPTRTVASLIEAVPR